MKEEIVIYSNGPYRHWCRFSVRASLVGFVAICFLIIQLLFSHHTNDPQRKEYVRKPNQRSFAWRDIQPSTYLEYHDCLDGLECARLDVPLDWTAPQDSERRVAVAIAKLPAKVPVTDPRYGGAILINPGGPGGSGVSFLNNRGKDIQTIVSSIDNPSSPESSGVYFDIISFDPRNVNNTTPAASCFPDDASTEAWKLAARAQGFPTSNETFANAWTRGTSLSKSCVWRLGSTEEDVQEIGKFMSTPSVVEDMVAIIEALGEWKSNKSISKHDLHSKDEISTGLKKEKEKLLYWGFSYGTVIGATFAAMHPDRVGRVALDGVVDAEDYYNGSMFSSLEDTDSIIESFFEKCHAAGPEKCALFSHGTNNIRQTYSRTLKSLLEYPLAVPASEKHGAEIITYHDAVDVVRRFVYSPQQNAARLARILKELFIGNGTEIAMSKQQKITNSCPSPLCQDNPWSSSCYTSKEGYGGGIACVDSNDKTGWTLDDMYHHWKALEARSKVLGGMWAEMTMGCVNWSLRPHWKFDQKISATNTSHPILWLSNTRDPVAPLSSARKMAKRFPGSVVFGQDADGHCTIAQPSRCVTKGIREYFQTGKLPEGDVGCQPDHGLFDADVEEQGLSIEEFRLARASKNLAEALHQEKFTLGVL